MGTSKPTVSVLMPIYNGEKYVREAVDSILGQTMADFEVVIIDDGSTDGTSDVLREYESRDKRIRVHRQENRGVTVSLNNGLELTRGRFVARMDADDISLPTRFAVQVEYLETHPEVGLVGTDFWVVDACGKVTRQPNLRETIAGLQVEWRLLWGGGSIAHPSVMYRPSIVKLCGGYPTEYPHVEDYALWIRMAKVTKLVALADPLLQYRTHETNVSIAEQPIQSAQAIQVACRALSELLGYIPPETCVRALRAGRPSSACTLAEFRQCLGILTDVFEVLAIRARDSHSTLDWLKTDLVDRLFSFAFADHRRSAAALAIVRALRFGPQVVAPKTTLHALIQATLGHPAAELLRRATY